MKTIKIKCPKCGAILTVVDEVSNKDKWVKCPICKERHMFKEFRLVTSQIEDDKTSLATSLRVFKAPSSNKDDAVPFGYLLDNNKRKYTLSEGVNLIGRKTVQMPQAASVPIETEDRGFSRKHLYIEVIKAPNGLVKKIAYNADNKNSTTINGVLLNKGDKIILHNNDIIKSANTELIFKDN